MQEKSEVRAGTGKARVRKVRIDAELAGQRIDNFLRRELPGVPRGRLYRLLRRGEVRVNGGRIRAEYRLIEGDEVRIPPVRLAETVAPPDRVAETMLELFADLPPDHEFFQQYSFISAEDLPVYRSIVDQAARGSALTSGVIKRTVIPQRRRSERLGCEP